MKELEKNELEKILNAPRSKTIYEKNYDKLAKIIDIDKLVKKQYLKLISGSLMDLNFDFLRKDDQNHIIIAMSHYYKENYDMIPDPDMELRINNTSEIKTVEALTFQDRYDYQEVYDKREGKIYVNAKLKKSFNKFLASWLNNIKKDGYKEE